MHHRARIYCLACLILAALGFGTGPLFGQEPFVVNSYPTGNQSSPKVVPDRDSGFFVAWTSGFSPDPNSGPDGQHRAVQGRRFSASGEPIGDEFTINATTFGDESIRSLDSDRHGRFVVVYRHHGDPLYNTEPVTTLYNTVDTDDSRGPSFEPDIFPAMAMAETGDFIISNGDFVDDVRLNRFEFDGTPLGSEIVVSPEDSGTRALDIGRNGEIVVAWDHRVDSDLGFIDVVQARLYDADGLPEGPAFAVNSKKIGLVGDIKPVFLRDGGFAVVWDHLPGEGLQLLGQVFNSDGSRRGEEFQVNTHQTDIQAEPKVSADPVTGGFAVVWQRSNPEDHPDGEQPHLLARRFNAQGEPQASEFTASVGTESESSIGGFDATFDARGNLITVWGERASPRNALGLRFPSTTVFQDSFESGDLSAWSIVHGLE